jgi:hypothetical protein
MIEISENDFWQSLSRFKKWGKLTIIKLKSRI